MQPYELRGPGFVLAMPDESDIDRVTEICQDPQVAAWTTVPSPYRREDSVFFLTQHVPIGWASGRDLTWAIRDQEDRRLLGMVGVSLTGDGSGEIGYWLAPDSRGRGLATAVVRLLAEHAFSPEGLDLQQLIWWAYVGNWASRRVAWRCGFRIEGTVRSGQPQRGRRRDAWVATLTRDDELQPLQPWLGLPVLKGDGLLLRPFVDGDADAIAEACADPHTQHWLGGRLGGPYTRDDACRYVEQTRVDAADGRAVRLAAARGRGGVALGAFELERIVREPTHGTAEVGYWVHPDARGQAVATEAVQLLISHAFAAVADGGLGLDRLTLARAAGNAASERVALNAGFRPVGVFRQAGRLGNGDPVDVHWYDLLAGDRRP